MAAGKVLAHLLGHVLVGETLWLVAHEQEKSDTEFLVEDILSTLCSHSKPAHPVCEHLNRE